MRPETAGPTCDENRDSLSVPIVKFKAVEKRFAFRKGQILLPFRTGHLQATTIVAAWRTVRVCAPGLTGPFRCGDRGPVDLSIAQNAVSCNREGKLRKIEMVIATRNSAPASKVNREISGFARLSGNFAWNNEGTGAPFDC
jgi:hypothetical protein